MKMDGSKLSVYFPPLIQGSTCYGVTLVYLGPMLAVIGSLLQSSLSVLQSLRESIHSEVANRVSPTYYGTSYERRCGGCGAQHAKGIGCSFSQLHRQQDPAS